METFQGFLWHAFVAYEVHGSELKSRRVGWLTVAWSSQHGSWKCVNWFKSCYGGDM